jgi:serine/threonine-protein kinase HipA
MTIATTSLRVWGGEQRAGLLERELTRDYVFAYEPDAPGEAQVSLTMPIRLKSWQSRELHPIFQMNLPEGALLDTIRHAIAKIIGEDDLAILRVTGGNQVGRNRFALPESDFPSMPDTTEELDELITFPDTRQLFHELVDRYAMRSGVSGIQPKVLLAAHERGTLAAKQYIVKSWGTDYPQLAANEFFCMTAVKKAGVPVPDFFLSENGGLFIMRRFDMDANNAPLGFEDFCSLQALGTAQKYQGSYERVARTLQDFITSEYLQAAREQFFSLLVLSVMLRNGDAHLKNFGVLYPSPSGPVTIAPAYDLVTTTAYLRRDVPALTLEGTKKWWPRQTLMRFAISRLELPVGAVNQIIQRAADAVADTRHELIAYRADHSEFRIIGELMLAEWERGIAVSGSLTE